MNIIHFERAGAAFSRAIAAMFFAFLAVASNGHAADAKAQAAAKQRVYGAPEEAVKSLVAAARAGDVKELAAILGAGSRGILESGDAVADKAGRERFVKSYDEASKLEKSGDSRVVLSVGKDGWPFPVPVVKEASGWRFDAGQGQEEVLNRRIGRNELSVIQVLQAVVDAQREYYLRNPQGEKLLHYAQRISSTKGKRDGLYFPTKSGERPSPLGPLVDSARAEGYGKGAASGAYHGYHYRLLRRQGPDAPGGAYSYVAQDRMIGGFAVIAWPATYGNSGVMTFMVSHDGVVYEKDLGAKSAEVAQKITQFNPDKSWQRVKQ
jgi:hypothetical protein